MLPAERVSKWPSTYPELMFRILPPKVCAPLALAKLSPDVSLLPVIQSETMGRVEIVASSIFEGHGVFRRVRRSETSGYVNVEEPSKLRGTHQFKSRKP